MVIYDFSKRRHFENRFFEFRIAGSILNQAQTQYTDGVFRPRGLLTKRSAATQRDATRRMEVTARTGLHSGPHIVKDKRHIILRPVADIKTSVTYFCDA